jgi:hypothetical protein
MLRRPKPCKTWNLFVEQSPAEQTPPKFDHNQSSVTPLCGAVYYTVATDPPELTASDDYCWRENTRGA